MPSLAERSPDPGDLIVRGFTPADLPEVLDLYEDRRFLYRTDRPDLLSESQVRDLIGPADLCCRLGDRLVGLFAADPLPAGYPGHHQVHMRFAQLAESTAARVVRQLVGALANRAQVRRLTHLVPGFDDTGRSLALASGFRDEGALAGLVHADGRRWPVHYFAIVVADYPLDTGARA